VSQVWRRNTGMCHEFILCSYVALHEHCVIVVSVPVALQVVSRGGLVVKGVGLVTRRSPDRLPSAAKFITLQYWTKLYALTHAQANSA